MKNTNIKIKKHTFLNSHEIEYQIGKEFFVMAIEEAELEEIFNDYDCERYNSPQDFLETHDDVEKLLIWFHTEWEFKDHIEPMDLQFSKLYKPKTKTAEKVIFKTNLQRVGNVPATLEMVNPAYIQAIVERMEVMQKRIEQLEEENEKRDDILLTTDQIKEHYGIAPQTINQARRYKRIEGRRINGKAFGYEQREVERYVNQNQNFFKNQKYAS
jgi:hypothetical protein